MRASIVGLIAGFMACAAPEAGALAASDLLVAEHPAAASKLPPKFRFFFGPAIHWTEPIRWYYNPEGAVTALVPDTAAAVAIISANMAKWTAACNVQFQYAGESARVPMRPFDGGPPNGVNVIGWDDTARFGPFSAGVTGLLSLPQSDGDRRLVEGGMALSNTGRIASRATLDIVVTHEVGHLLGLDHSDRGGSVMSGPPDTNYTSLPNLQIDDIRGCRCLYGPPAGQSAAYTCSLPKRLDFGIAPVGTPAAPQSFTVFNDGNVPLAIADVIGSNAQVQVSGTCAAGTVLAPGASCVVHVAAQPSGPGERQANVNVVTNDGTYSVPAIFSGVEGPPTVDAIEYYNPGLDHYFLTWIGNEIGILDAGVRTKGWARTGKTVRTYPVPQPDASPLCRYYIPPDKGNSHFYGRGSAECTQTGAKNPTFVLEDPAFMFMVLPGAGMCPAQTTPVYRVFSDRPDANHRYTTDPAVRDEMVARGWLAEGDGPDRIVMCAPR